jgi:ammonium transporter, Amt family
VAAFACATTLTLTAAPAFAQAGKIDGADTAWMMVATAIVLMMTIPGLAYAGMVRKKNVLATMAQSLAATALVSILWIAFGVGWFGFNGGSALGANSRAVMAMVSTHLAASAGALTWIALEWWLRGKPSLLGMVSGAVAGLGTITPASGFVLPWHSVVIGIAAGAYASMPARQSSTCTSTMIHSLDVFGVHGAVGATGTLLCGVFAMAALSVSPATPAGNPGLLEGHPIQVLTRLCGIVVTIAWSGGITIVVLKIVGALMPLRASQEEERQGLDISPHGEALQ